MKKNLWVLLALSALIAMFIIAGCAPKPSPSPTPTPTATPKPTPKPDTAAPKVVSTDVYKFYGTSTCSTCVDDICITVGEELYCCDEYGNFKIVITFDENIDPLKSSCMLNPGNWTIDVTNSGRYAKGNINAEVYDVAIDGKKVILTGGVIEAGTNVVHPDPTNPTSGVDVFYTFCGLICNTNDAKAYAAAVNGDYNGFPVVGVIAPPATADSVSWTLSSTCVVSDELGNSACGYSGSDCCLEDTCEECVDECPLGSDICL